MMDTFVKLHDFATVRRRPESGSVEADRHCHAGSLAAAPSISAPSLTALVSQSDPLSGQLSAIKQLSAYATMRGATIFSPPIKWNRQ